MDAIHRNVREAKGSGVSFPMIVGVKDKCETCAKEDN